ncbi:MULTISPECIES: NAD(P)/FAD-dependent oxidoreductase [unclassified Okeania]|uniref:NAD(P)/FAD-dependent oxidoreductase n=1 Tax=unclassified Okeania TaxID=2634635 RepID=UPI0013BDB3E6|nr:MULTISPECIES: tryptophan 7-halogenase [unclassified Okeania]NES77479.1 NAD(P)-binding protein [Okeania sp. SIO1H4]NET13337.1 NAD(P)-binding protein [Okeania sp. SIO1H6]NET21159.1 NAD(P)-binding protein [Okeania sp. SIO1H5]NET94252.1 NAD(P)-binding protein [Okeania sp. SIO1H2]
MSEKKMQNFDIIILGSGLAGSILATILAKHNLRVLIIDKNAHPRFAIGEAMTPDTDLMMEILSHQYSVPEIAHLSSFKNICENISPSACGLKRSFNFIYHRQGEEQKLQETNKLGVRPSSHLFRQDVDHYMAKVAVKYGATLLEKTKVLDLDINSQGVKVELEDGKKFTSEYLVDASGYNSLLSRKFNLREVPTRFKTHSRSIFTHMVGVERYDDCVNNGTNEDEIFWYQGTLHHIFDGGWMWVIPFNNHEKSTNQICSVGLNLDPRRFPKTDISPEQEFQNFLSNYPGVAVQFKNAKPVQNWISTDRLQYSSHSCTGERFYVLPHATGFIDPLYSFGLVNSCTIMLPLASLIMKAISENDYSMENFSKVERLQQKLLDYNDNLVNCSYISFCNYNLWDAWRRIWGLGSFMRQAKAGLAKSLKIQAGKAEELSKINLDDELYRLTPSYEGLGDGFFQKATETVEKVESGLLSPDEAADKIISLINSIDFLPENFLQLGDFSQKHIDLKSDSYKSEYIRFLSWIKKSRKPEIKKCFDYDMADLLAAKSKDNIKLKLLSILYKIRQIFLNSIPKLSFNR